MPAPITMTDRYRLTFVCMGNICRSPTADGVMRHKLKRLTEFCTRHDSPVVPDPYYGGAQGFEQVLDLVEDACDGLLMHIAGLPKKQAPR